VKANGLSVRVFSFILVLVLTGTWQPVPVHAGAILVNLPGPPGSGAFGTSVTVLSNGNFVVTDPGYNLGRGAVYLYSPNGVLISQLIGDLVGDRVGSGGITVLTNGNYLVLSPYWDGSVTDYDLGAVTWCSQVTGCSGTVSASNSLVGSTAGDQVGGNLFGPVTVLTNGNYVVSSPSWDNGPVYNAGAVTWGNGLGGTTGVVSDANSLVGSTAYDEVGGGYEGAVLALTNGNYLVRNAAWDHGSLVDAGAVTWGNGMGGTAGAVSDANSLVGTTAEDRVGNTFDRVTELANGNYVVSSRDWDLDATHADVGAVTWGSGTTGVMGPISDANSLVGTSDVAPVGDLGDDNLGVTALANGNYVVSSPLWSPDGTASRFGAVTWANGATGISGSISAANSLVGSSYDDSVGTVTALTNGNYVVSSPYWALDGASVNAGAVTWGSGTAGITGPVSAANSLVGHSLVCVGSGGVFALANGNYAVSSPSWYDKAQGVANIGAVTWGDGTTGTTGPVSTANSLVGENTYDSIGDRGLVALTNGNYVVITSGISSSDGVGLVTWVDGSHATTGLVSAANSLVGIRPGDAVGGGLWNTGVIPLANGNYVVSSPWWDNGGITDAGAVTWGNGASGTTGVVSEANSLVGSTPDDRLGTYFWDGGVTALANGNYVVSSPQWDDGTTADAGAVTWGNGTGGTTGPVSASNSLVGSTAGDSVGDGSFWGAAGVTELAHGNYVVNSPHWSSGTAVGAITWGDGTSGITGPVSTSNSLVNTSANDEVFCNSALTPFPDGSASLHFPSWSDGSSDGAVSLLACGLELMIGPVSTANSVLGTAQLGGDSMVSGYDAVRTQLIVGRPADNTVTILRCQGGYAYRLYLPMVLR
jgi:hypothetical protein